MKRISGAPYRVHKCLTRVGIFDRMINYKQKGFIKCASLANFALFGMHPSPHQPSTGLYYKTFYCRNCCHITKRETVCHCHSLPRSLIFAGKDRSLPWEWSHVKGFTLVGLYPCSQILDMGGSGWQQQTVSLSMIRQQLQQ